MRGQMRLFLTVSTALALAGCGDMNRELGAEVDSGTFGNATMNNSMVQTGAIDAATMERAAELALWHLGEAARLAGTAALSPEVRDAEALLAWAHESRHARVYSTMALNRGPARIREVESFRQAMGELERAGWAMPIEGGAMMDGRHRRHVWDVLPQSSGGE